MPEPHPNPVKLTDPERGLISGLAIPFAGPLDGRDLEGEFFSAQTNFHFEWFPEGRPLLYDHGFDAKVRQDVVGRQTIHRVDDIGIWAEAQLNRAHQYADAILRLINDDKALGFSSASVGHLVNRSNTGEILNWPWVELSLTPTPANPWATIDDPSKSLEHFNTIGLTPPDTLLESLYEAATKPFPNEHACRLRDPGGFEPNSFRRTTREHEGKRYSIIMGRLKGQSTMTEQAYRYPKDTWSVSQARSHCRGHDGSLFEPASDSASRCAQCGGGLSLEDHFLEVASSLDDFVERVEDVAYLRARDGRRLSPVNLDRLSALRVRIDSMMAGSPPDPGPAYGDRERALRLHQVYLRTLVPYQVRDKL